MFKSADPDYFISHVDVTRIMENREAAAKLDGNPSIGQVLRHMSASRLVTIAQIEGRVRGVGSEFKRKRRKKWQVPFWSPALQAESVP